MSIQGNRTTERTESETERTPPRERHEGVRATADESECGVCGRDAKHPDMIATRVELPPRATELTANSQKPEYPIGGFYARLCAGCFRDAHDALAAGESVRTVLEKLVSYTFAENKYHPSLSSEEMAEREQFHSERGRAYDAIESVPESVERALETAERINGTRERKYGETDVLDGVAAAITLSFWVESRGRDADADTADARQALDTLLPFSDRVINRTVEKWKTTVENYEPPRSTRLSDDEVLKLVKENARKRNERRANA